MRKKQLAMKFAAAALSALMGVTTVFPVSAAAALSPVYTYTGGEYTFEKVSHPNSPVETADGIVDYIGNGSIAPYGSGEGESSEGNGDRGQSYSYASAVYGDWVYINTMYGGLGVSAILSIGMDGMDPELTKAMLDTMYNGNLYTGEPDGKYAGGVLLKFNVKTGETKLLMSRDTNGLIPTFRNACVMNGKLYFVGMVIDFTKGLSQQEIQTAIAMQNGFPCIYEIDPSNGDKITCIYECVDVAGYNVLVDKGVFTSTRAIGIYEDTLIAGCLDTGGVFLCASDDPSAGQESFNVIADMNDLFNYPAYHRQDVNGGGGIYQVIEYNNKLYVVICTGTAESKNEYGTLQTFAIVRGECSGDPTERSSWNWSVLAGDEADGARYPFGLDKERVSAGACTLEVFNDYLYIGEYNDVSSALQGFILRKDFTTQATNLEQSINLYRMDKNENVEMLVGDPTEQFPEGGSTGWGSGYETHMSQYTWQTMVYEGKMYVSTMDTTTLLEPIAQFTNGDLLEMSPEEWRSQINYIRVLLELMFESDDVEDIPDETEEPVDETEKSTEIQETELTEDSTENPDVDLEETIAEMPDSEDNVSDETSETAYDVSVYAVAALAEDTDTVQSEDSDIVLSEDAARAMVEEAISQAAERAQETSVDFTLIPGTNESEDEPVSLTGEQITELINGLLDGSISAGQIDEEQLDILTQINNILYRLAALIDTTEIEEFATAYESMLEEYSGISDFLPDNLKGLFDVLLSFATKDNLLGLIKSIKYMRTSQAGFDLYEITDNGDGTVSINTITNDGFGDRYNHGLRIFARTSDYLLVGTANPFYGTQLWRRENTVKEPTEPTEPTDSAEPIEPTKPMDPAELIRRIRRIRPILAPRLIPVTRPVQINQQVAPIFRHLQIPNPYIAVIQQKDR
ncbi:MAG: hypothetical protein ACI4R7_00730 [Oliverpabstia sp.]